MIIPLQRRIAVSRRVPANRPDPWPALEIQERDTCLPMVCIGGSRATERESNDSPSPVLFRQSDRIDFNHNHFRKFS